MEVTIPAGLTKAQVDSAIKAYEARKLYQEGHNKIDRQAKQVLKKRHEGEYKQIFEALKAGTEPSSLIVAPKPKS